MRKGMILLLCSFLITGVIYSCGGGGGGSSAPPVSSSPMITGTAASGAAHGHRPIEIGDGGGNHGSGETDDNGNFSIPSTGLTPPFLLRVITSAPTATLYSVSADLNASTTINITPLTDLIIRAWYSAQTPSVSIDLAFADLQNHPAPSPSVVSYIHDLIKNVVQLWLDKNGVTSSDFNLISTPFTAGTITVPGTGLDTVLHQALVNAATGQIVISDGTTTQNSVLTAFLSSLTTSNTTVSSSSGSVIGSGHNDLTTVPTDTAMQAALDGINTTLANMATTINTTPSLTYTHLTQYVDPTALNDGLDQTMMAYALTSAALKAKAAGKSVLYQVESIRSLNTISNVAELRIKGLGLATFKLDSGSGNWLILGNGRLANIAVNATMNTRYDLPSASGPKMTVKVEAPQGLVTGVTVSGGGIWNAATDTIPDNVVGPGYNLDRFWFDSGALPSLPPKDTPFLVSITTATGLIVDYTIPSNAYTTEPSTITNPGVLATLTPGVKFTIQWSKPLTFPVRGMGVGVQAYNGGRSGATLVCPADSVIMAGSGVTSADVIVPTMCGGVLVGAFNLDIGINGLNGENVSITYAWH